MEKFHSEKGTNQQKEVTNMAYDPNETNKEANRQLIRALKEENSKLIEDALNKGADPAKGGYELLEYAIRSNQTTDFFNSIMYKFSKKELGICAQTAILRKNYSLMLYLQKIGIRVRINKEFIKQHYNNVVWLYKAGLQARLTLDSFDYAVANNREMPQLLEILIGIMKNSERPEEFKRKLHFVAHNYIIKGNITTIIKLESLGASLHPENPWEREEISQKASWGIQLYLQRKGVKF